MTKPKAVIFDMYETLVSNPLEDWMAVFDEIIRKQKLPLSPDELYRQWKVLEVQFRQDRLNLDEPEKSPPFKNYETAWRECFAAVFNGLDAPQADAAEAARSSVQSMGRRDAFPETHSAIADIQSRFATAVLSNADDDYLLPQLRKLELTFPVVLSSEMVQAYKPLPLPFQRALAALDLEPSEAVYVGDNQFDDVLGAGGVGMSAVWVNRYGKPLDKSLPTPDHVVSSLSELPEILERWN